MEPVARRKEPALHRARPLAEHEPHRARRELRRARPEDTGAVSPVRARTRPVARGDRASVGNDKQYRDRKGAGADRRAVCSNHLSLSVDLCGDSWQPEEAKMPKTPDPSASTKFDIGELQQLKVL